MSLIKKVIHLIKNHKEYDFNEIDEAVRLKRFYEDIIETLSKKKVGDVEIMEKIVQSTHYNIDFRFSKLAEITASITECRRFSDYELVKGGFNPSSIIKSKDKLHVIIINNMMTFTNPLYDIYKIDMDDDKMHLEIDSIINANMMYDLVKDIYSKHFDMEVTLDKSYLKDRVCLKINLKSKDLYKALELFTIKLNNRIMNMVENTEHDIDSVLKHYSEYIEHFDIDFSILDKMSFGYKESITEIVNSHRLVINYLKDRVDKIYEAEKSVDIINNSMVGKTAKSVTILK